jgi:hypothetical protein
MQARKLLPVAELDELDALGVLAAVELVELVELVPDELLPQAASSRAAAVPATTVISEVCLTVISSVGHVGCTSLARYQPGFPHWSRLPKP